MVTLNEQEDPRFVAAKLQAVLIGADRIESFLAEVAHEAVGVVGSKLACGVTVRATGRSRFLGATTDEFAERMDSIQYDIDDGPCLTCLRNGVPVAVDDIPGDPRWPPFSQRGQAEGAAQSFSVPMTAGGHTVGALNLYARQPDVLTDEDRDRAREFAHYAAGAVALSVRLAEREDEARHLEVALRSRSTIDQAIGVLMREFRVDNVAAFQLLVKQSQNTNAKLRDVAAQVITRLTGNHDQAGCHTRQGQS
jgi:GAF domain-containing protein